MEMKVNGQLIRSHREQRAWSQEHLAEVCSLGLRTIQRIEASGLASYESIKAIAAVFGVSVTELLPESAPSAWLKRVLLKPVSAIAASAALTVSVLIGTQAWAKDVMLDLGMDLNGQKETGRLITAEGKAAEVRMNDATKSDAIKLVMVPKVLANGGVQVSVRIFESNGRDYVLVSEPRIITANKKEAAIEIKSDGGNRFRVQITPTIR